MLADIQRHFDSAQGSNKEKEKCHTIPRNYVMQNREIKICGEGMVQRMLERYRESS